MKKSIIWKVAGASTIFLILLVIITGLSWGFQETAEKQIEAIYVVIAFTPFVFYLFLSDKLKQFKGGGIELTLRDEVDKEVTTYKDDEPIEYLPELAGAKAGPDTLRNMLEREHPTTLSFVIGRSGYYANQAIKNYVDELSSLSTFRHVLFEDDQKKFLGYMHADDFRKMLQSDTDIVEQIETGRILQNDTVIQGFIHKDTTNKKALDKMDSLNSNELAVVDKVNRFVGTITQEEIVRKILTKVIREA